METTRAKERQCERKKEAKGEKGGREARRAVDVHLAHQGVNVLVAQAGVQGPVAAHVLPELGHRDGAVAVDVDHVENGLDHLPRREVPDLPAHNAVAELLELDGA